MKPIKETKLGHWLQQNFPKVLDTVGDVLPDKGGLGIIKNLIKSQTGISEEQMQEAMAKVEALSKELLELIELELRDREGARKMQESALAQDDLFSKRFIYYLSTFIIVSATVFGIMLFFVEVPEQNKRLVEMFSDVYLFAGALTVLNFFFGNAFSRIKQKLIR